MPIRFGLFVTLFFALLGTEMRSFATDKDPEFERIRSYLEALPEIRAYVADGINFGLQKSTLDGIQRLVDFGFRGRIELIYHDRSANKVKTFTEFKPTFFKGALTEYISQSDFERRMKAGEVRVISVGFMGGEGETPVPDRGELAVETLVKIQPAYHYSGERSIQWRSGHVTDLEEYFSLGLYEAFSRVKDVAEWSRATLKEQSPILAELIYGAYSSARTHKVMTAYGFHSITGKVPTIGNLLSGIRLVQSETPSKVMGPGLNKPPMDLNPTVPPLASGVVIVAAGLTLSPFELENLGKFIEGSSLLKDHVEILLPSNDQSPQKVQNVPPGKIVLIPTGWLPPEMIPQLLVSGDLSPVASSGLTRVLMMQQKIPFMEAINVKQPHLDNFSKEAKHIAFDQVMDLVLEKGPRLPGRGFARFIMDGLSSQSIMRSEFARNALPITQKDIVFQAISRVVEGEKPQQRDCKILRVKTRPLL